MSAPISEPISEFLRERIAAGDFPSAVYLVAERGEIVFMDALGFAVVEPQRIKARTDTIYDLASLTKVLITSLLCAKLIEAGEISLFEKIAEYSHFFQTKDNKETTIENLLTHTSGFQAWKPLYLVLRKYPSNFISSDWMNIISEIPNANPSDSTVLYSDLNFITLGFLLEQLYEQSIEEVAKKEIFEPLNLQNTFFNPPKELRQRIAASEFGNKYEKQMCADLNYDFSKYDWRDYQIWGEVHDCNCYFMKGISGHAGLFSTAEETFKIAQQFLAEETVLLQPETCRLFRTNYTENFNEARSIAFQLAAIEDSTAGRALAKDSFGHLGFTGTSLWIEPETERIFILLTNRTHARNLPFANIHDTRRTFHELAAAILNERK